jgi:hypothetical protein
MRSRLLINIFLVVVFALLGAYLFIEQKEIPTPSQRLISSERDEIAKISIVKNKTFEMDFTKNSVTWFITKPFRARANPEVIKLILDLSEATAISELEKFSENFGLNSPEYTVKLNQENLTFGSINDVTNEQYIQVGKRVFLTKTHHGYNLPHDPIKVVDRRLLGAEEKPIIFESSSWLAKHSKDGLWTITSKLENSISISSAKLDIWATGWRTTAATKINEAHDSNAAENDSIEITFERGKKITFTVEQDDDGYLIRRSDEDIAYRVGNDSGLRLIDPQEVARKL